MSTIIGLVSTFRLPLHGKHRGSPKGVRKSGRLDVEVAGSTEKVQKGFAEAADWTLKQREARKKSKRDLQKRRIGR